TRRSSDLPRRLPERASLAPHRGIGARGRGRRDPQRLGLHAERHQRERRPVPRRGDLRLPAGQCGRAAARPPRARQGRRPGPALAGPLNDDFLTNHNDSVITNYWANWDLCTMASVLAIGVFTDREDLVDRAVTYFQDGEGNGSILHAIPFVYDDENLAQWQESGRDQGHSIMGIGLMAAFCEMAWSQGIDCWGHDDNRFLKAAEYVAKY